MKKIFVLIVSSLAIFGSLEEVSAQSNSYFSMSTYVDAGEDGLDTQASAILEEKLKQIVSSNGISSSASRFVFAARTNLLSKDILGTAPASFVYTLSLTFVIGDGLDGNKFASKNITVKGVGTNETKALINAFKTIKANDPEMQNFIAAGKNQITQYYNSRCASVIKEAKMLENQNQFDEALYRLTGIPESSSCYDKALASVDQLYRKKIDRECRLKLAEAQNYWNSNPTSEGASVVADILSGIDPRSACYKEVSNFASKVGKRVIEIDGREWKFKVDQEIGLEKDRLKTIKDIGVAWGNGQPKNITYGNTRGWW